ncbi:MAG: hypothetical protein IEMM0008_0901 [bacterium]|nr:MAG: hypothetical protein IEMM0008_0901 [bacterium]
MQEIGRVIQVEEDMATILLEPSSACGSCNSCSSMDGGEKGPKTLSIRNTIEARPNDRVVLALSTPKSIVISVFLYVFPLIMMMIGYTIGEEMETGKLTERGDSPTAILLSVIFLVLSFVLIYFADKLAGRKNKLSPELIRVHERAEASYEDPQLGYHQY